MNTMRIKVKDAGRVRIFCFIVFFIGVMLIQDKSLYSKSSTHTQSVIVEQGQTLWSIASKYKNENEDSRNFIAKVREINQLSSSSLREGQEIYIPVNE